MPDHEPVHDRRREGQAAAGRQRQRGLRDQVPVPHRRPDLGRARTSSSRVWRRPASRRRRSPTTSRTTRADATTRQRTSTSGPSAGARTGRPVRPGSRRSSSRPTSKVGLRHQLRRVQRAGRRPEDQRRSSRCRRGAAGCVERARQGDHDEVPSRVSRGTTAASPRRTDRRSTGTSRQHRGHADLEGHLGRAVTLRSTGRHLAPTAVILVVGWARSRAHPTHQVTEIRGTSAMSGYIVRRLISAFLVVILTSMFVFALFFLGPEQPRAAAVRHQRPVHAREAGAAHRAAVGLDESVVHQYGIWVEGHLRRPRDRLRRRRTTATPPASASPTAPATR